MKPAFAIIILCVIALVIYSNTFNATFHFDDDLYISNNLSIRDIWNVGEIWSFYPTRFIVFFTLALNYHFNQLNVFGYHLFNLLIHLGSAILAWWLTLLAFSTPAIKEERGAKHSYLLAFFAGLIFLSHPLQTESVTYIWQRCTSLAGFLYLFSVCLYIKSRLSQGSGSPPPKWIALYALSCIFAVLSMLTKENSASLPLVIILCEICLFKKARLARYRFTIPFLLMLPLIPILLFSARPETRPELFNFTQRFINYPFNKIGEYFLTELKVIVTYIRLLFIPINQNLDYDYPISKSLLNLPTLGSLIILAVIVYGALRLFSKYKLLSFGIFWFLLTLLPESTIIPLDDVIFEHRLYLPMAGFSIFLVSTAYYFLGAKNIKPIAVVLLIIATCYSLLAYRRNFVWKDDITLWEDTLRKSPLKAKPYNSRGLAYARKGKPEQAISDYNQAIQINPDFFKAYINRGNAYQIKGKLEQAISDYNQAIQINPDFADSYINRGNAYQIKGALDEAISDYNQAVEINPRSANAFYNRGLAYGIKGDLTQAISDYNQAIEIDRSYEKAYYNRGLTYALNNNLGQAISDYDRVIKINPANEEAYYNRGLAYAYQKKYDQAISDFSIAIKINPNYADAYYDRGVAYSQKKEIQKAKEDLNKAAALGYQ